MKNVVVHNAAAKGNLDSVMYLHENRGEGSTTKAMDEAAGHGHFNIVKFLHENRTEGCTGRGMDIASRNGHLEISGHLDVVKFLFFNSTEGNMGYVVNRAAKRSNLEIVQFYHENDIACTMCAMNNATANGHLDVVKFLHDNRTEGYTTNAFDWATLSQHWDVLIFLLTASRGKMYYNYHGRSR
ncbi:hypothetical protein THRCLA_21153 [Thraustotheca clavata]|uniref:Uncharacterized protein n=1 Tax=Thraustotheca clavata TaxID=74557 RepID=A0A1V9ZZP9_9STRA|nr:hypothetical protein THRCLA_21153 [Thraustotheca clavata]